LSITPQKESQVAWRRRKDARTPEILKAARILIEEQGAAKTSISRIADAAGVSEATVYNYFESKQDLLNRVLEEWAGPFIERLLAELEQFHDVRSRLILIATRYMRSLDETPKLHRVIFQEIRWSDYTSSSMYRLNRKFSDTVLRTVEDGIRSGELDAEVVDPAMFRDMLFGGLEHIALRTSFAGKPLNVELAAARYIDMMLQGSIPRSARVTVSDELVRLSTLIDRLEQAAGTNGGGDLPKDK
jgi:AcrR family transcriptional regulator